MTKEALKQRLGMTQPNRGSVGFQEALAQPEQDGKCKYCTDGCPACDARKLPPQRTWVGLTDEEILDNCESVPDYDIGNYDLIQFARAIEAKLKEKNELR